MLSLAMELQVTGYQGKQLSLPKSLSCIDSSLLQGAATDSVNQCPELGVSARSLHVHVA